MSGYLRGLDESGWMKHVKNVMDTSLFIAKVFLSFHFIINDDSLRIFTSIFIFEIRDNLL